MKYNRKNSIKYYTREPWESKSLNNFEFETCLEQYLGNGNFQKPELIAGLSDQLRQPFCWTDAVFAGLGHRSSGLFRRLVFMGCIYPNPSGLPHWHWGNHMIAPVLVKQPWRIWVKLTSHQTTTNTSCGIFLSGKKYTHQWSLLLTWFNFNPSMDK